jgi:TonB family protein
MRGARVTPDVRRQSLATEKGIMRKLIAQQLLLFFTAIVALPLTVEAQTFTPLCAQESAKDRQNGTCYHCCETLNHKAVGKLEAKYPKEAKAVGVSGYVVVYVKVDEKGRVYSAMVCNGHPLLRQAAVDAAGKARLTPTRVSGKPVKVCGVLIYSFTSKKV